MKKIIKSFKEVFLLEDVSNNQQGVKPKAPSNSNSENKQKKAEASLSVAANQSQNNSQSEKAEAGLPTIQPEEAVEADKIEYFSQRQLYRNGCRLFLGGLPDNIAEAEVSKAFEYYGKVIDVVIPFDRDTNKPKRYGYLEFENEDSAKACLDDHFVTVGGRRVEVKKAWPRGCNTKKENCDKKETKEMGNHEKFIPRPEDLESSSESLSYSDSESNTENSQFLYQKLFEDYFKAKFFLQNLLGPETASNAVLSEDMKNQQENEEKVKKILRGLYVTTEEDSPEEEDNEDFSGDTDDTQLTFDELEYSVRGGSAPSDQTKSMPLSVMAERRVCNMCKWTSLDNSAESFLAHCKTIAHKQKLKERFRKKATPGNPQNNTETHANSSNNNQNIKQNVKKRGKKKQKENQNKKEGNLVLKEIMSSVEAKTEKCLKCKLCNKTIPQAADVRGLMANLSHHLQSKGHLARISKLEKSRCKSENVPGKKIEVKVDTSKNEKTAPVKEKHKHSKNAVINKNLAETTKSPKTETSTKTKGLLCKSERIFPPNTSIGSKVRFHCLLCNYFCSQPKTFLTHLHSEVHFANDKQTSSSRSSLKTASLESLCSNLISCLSCNTYLYGCSNSIKNHFTKCKKY